MKISFSTLGCPRWSFREIMATAVDLHYQGIEVRGIGKDIERGGQAIEKAATK